MSIGNDFLVSCFFPIFNCKGIDQNAELISNVEKYLQFLVVVTRPTINGNGWTCGAPLLFRSLNSKHNLVFLLSSFLKAKVLQTDRMIPLFVFFGAIFLFVLLFLFYLLQNIWKVFYNNICLRVDQCVLHSLLLFQYHTYLLQNLICIYLLFFKF